MADDPHPELRAIAMATERRAAIRTIAMPADTNANGDIFGGWLMSRWTSPAATSPPASRGAASPRSRSTR
jgi:acyl-CoA hydrolase